MALRDQPYIPFYVDDYLTDEKLNLCSAASQGVYIKIMCLMHKSEPYGTILLKQKDKQSTEQVKNFACKLARLLPFTVDEISSAITDLVEEDVLQLADDTLSQKRMIKDNSISILRSKAGSKGGKKTQLKTKNFALAKSEANSVDVNENENENDFSIKNVKFFESERLNTAFSKWLTMCAERDKRFTETSISEIVSSLNAVPESEAMDQITQSLKNGWVSIREVSAKSTGKGKRSGKEPAQTASEQAGIDYGEGL